MHCLVICVCLVHYQQLRATQHVGATHCVVYAQGQSTDRACLLIEPCLDLNQCSDQCGMRTMSWGASIECTGTAAHQNEHCIQPATLHLAGNNTNCIQSKNLKCCYIGQQQSPNLLSYLFQHAGVTTPMIQCCKSNANTISGSTSQLNFSNKLLVNYTLLKQEV